MAERRVAIIRFLICLCLCLLVSQVPAASMAYGMKLIAPETECSLTIACIHDGKAISNVPVKLYKIADVSEHCQFTLTPSFQATGLEVTGIQTDAEWDTVSATMKSHVSAANIQPDYTAKTDQDGLACFEPVETGLYMAICDRTVKGSWRYTFKTAMISVPGMDADENWMYQVTAAVKSEANRIPDPEDPEPEVKEIEYKVLKLWKGDEGETDRPSAVEVEIFKDGVRETTVVLSEENHWSWSWTAKDDGADWTAAERNVPDAYTVTVTEQGTAFVLTNTRVPKNPPPPEDPTDPPGDDPSDSPTDDPSDSPTDDPSDAPTDDPSDAPNDGAPEKPSKNPDDIYDINNDGPPGASKEENPDPSHPKTGDTSNIMLYTILLYVSGCILILLGIAGKRNRHEN